MAKERKALSVSALGLPPVGSPRFSLVFSFFSQSFSSLFVIFSHYRVRIIQTALAPVDI